jgi:hypothetical protein
MTKAIERSIDDSRAVNGTLYNVSALLIFLEFALDGTILEQYPGSQYLDPRLHRA